MKPILVTGYVDPDLDSTAGAIAYSEFLNKTGLDTVVKIIGNPHDEVKFVLDKFKITCPEIILNANDFEQIILVDCSDANRLDGKISTDKVIEIIDHREIHEAEKFPNAKAQIERVGAVVTLIAEKFIQNNVDISRESAILLFSAVISNTLNFNGGVTTDRDRAVAEWLGKVAKLPENYWKELFIAKSYLDGDKLVERIINDLKWFNLGNKNVGIAQIEMIGGRELVAQRIEEIKNILRKIKQEKNFDHLFLTIIELDGCYNILVAEDGITKKLLEEALGVKFTGDSAERPTSLMRKQIVPLLKEKLELEH